MMERFFLTFISIIITLTTGAQTAREDFKRNTHFSASNYLAYPGPKQHKQTPVPKGKKPFYLSHYGRHGSRFLINKNEYDFPVQTLQRADSLHQLTPLGQDVLQRVISIRREADQRLGELSPLGAEQHRQIARRMMERFPEVFEGAANIDAKSTIVRRCILSMENALLQLTSMNPQLRIRHDASQHDMWYMNLTDTALFAKRSNPEVERIYDAYVQKHYPGDRAVLQLFIDTAYVHREVDTRKLNNTLFKLASNLQSTELRHRMTLYDLFTDDEIYANWQLANARWYIEFGGCTLNGGQQPYSQRNLLRQIIQEADDCLKLEKPGATLRFGHETMVMPLTCLMELDRYGLATSDLESLEQEGWLNYRIFPMAANIQLIFYRRNANDGDVLVKVLLNENEVKLPLKSKIAPYYRWADVRKYYLQKLYDYDIQ